MKVINFFGGPGIGKSTSAAKKFYDMKQEGKNVELITEYAKDMVWENRNNILDDQLYLFAKQHRKLERLRDVVDYVIVDSPLIMSMVYIKDDYYKNLKPLIYEAWNSFDNANILLKREKEYNPIGRLQTELEAIQKDLEIKNLLDEYNIEYHEQVYV